MALDPTLSTYALAVAAASGVVASGMHATHIASGNDPWPPRRKLVADLIRAAVMGMVVEEAIRYGPGQWQLPPVLLAAGVVGGTLGPRGLPWLLGVAWATVRKLVVPLANAPDLPPDDPPTIVPPRPEVPREPE